MATDNTFEYKGLPFMFVRLNADHSAIEKFIVIIAKHDYPYANTEWMCDDNLPKDRTLRPDIDICIGNEEESHFEFDTEEEMIQFVSNWYHKNYPQK